MREISECRGVAIEYVLAEDVKIGDRLCLWLSDASAYCVVTGWSDKVIDLSAQRTG